MPKREERRQRLEEEARRYREQAERQVTVSVWDRDPIKQYVRRFGWLQVIQGFIRRQREAGVDRPLEYLTLPGPNASDIGLLWKTGLIERANDGFPHVVICDCEQAEEIVAKLKGVRGYSNRWFHEAVQGPKSDLGSYFPFDVINMDIQQPIIPARGRKNLEAIRWIFQLQRGQSFLLLITTKPDRAAIQRLKGVLEDNLQNEEKFREAYFRRYGTFDVDPCLEDYTAFTQLILPKVIARIGRQFGYETHELFAAQYSRPDENDEQYEIICHSLEFEPLGRRKSAKKYQPRFKKIPQDEVADELSTQIRVRAEKAYENFLPMLVQRDPKDIRSILHADPDLETELRDKAELLIGWEKLDKPEMGPDNEFY